MRALKPLMAFLHTICTNAESWCFKLINFGLPMLTLTWVSVHSKYLLHLEVILGSHFSGNKDGLWSVHIKPAYGLKAQLYPDLTATSIHAKEVSKSQGTREPIEWKLITNLPVKSLAEAAEKLHWYSLRWKIEIFFKILKSGCKVEESKLRTAEALCKLISINSIVAWRIFWMTMLNREAQSMSPKLALSELEMKLLDHLKPDKIP
jgi:hypothetical protein